MDVKELVYFLQICEDKSISKAAKKLYITPQALSKTIINLENKLNIILFKRTTSGVELTKYGEVLKKRSKKIIRSIEDIYSEIDDLRNNDIGNINISAACGTINYLSPNYIFDFNKLYPNIKINICEQSDFEVDKRVDEMKSDIGLALGPVDDNKFNKIHISSENYMLMVNKANPLSNKNSISFQDLKDQPMVSESREYKVFTNLVKGCSNYGFSPNITFETTEINLMHDLCNLSKGCAVTVEFAVAFETFKNIVLIPITDADNSWDLYLITKKNVYESSSVKLFKQYMSKWVKN